MELLPYQRGRKRELDHDRAKAEVAIGQALETRRRLQGLTNDNQQAAYRLLSSRKENHYGPRLRLAFAAEKRKVRP